MMAKKPIQIYQIKVTLDDIHPPIWRRFLVSGKTTLLKLHDILQIVMGWKNSHLHMFKIEGVIYGNPQDDETGRMHTQDEVYFTLSQVLNREGQQFAYEYDFGDSWDHTLLVEKILLSEEGFRYPQCLAGKRACPPEDVGGVWGYQHFLEAIRDPTDAEHDEYLNWIGGKFNAGAFDLEEINRNLRQMGRGLSTETRHAWFMEEAEPVEKKLDLASSWSQKLAEDERAIAENLPLRRDVVTLLTYLRDHKVIGTASSGNLPLKAIYEICAQFVNPPRLDETLGEHVYRTHSETEVWPLYFRHLLAAIGGFVAGGPSQRWNLTPAGERFLAVPTSIQVWFLLVIWWTKTNWAIASRFGYGDDYLPYGFTQLTLTHLLSLPADSLAPFEPFADRLIEVGKLSWPMENQESAQSNLRWLVEWVVVEPLADFGILAPRYEPNKILGGEYKELAAFQVTAFGKGLLKAVETALRQ